MSSDSFDWHDFVSKLRRIEGQWKPSQQLPGTVSAYGNGLHPTGVLSVLNSQYMPPPGVLRALPGYETFQRVSNVVKAIEDAEPVAFNTIAKRLQGISIDDIKPILANIIKDLALYVGGSTVVGAGIGATAGAFVFGAGAIPGAVIGAGVGAEVGNLILAFTGLKSIAIFMKDAIPVACKCYVAGFKEAWGPFDMSRDPSLFSATNDFARGHVLFMMALLMGIVAYLTRGKGNFQSLLAEVRGSARLGPRMATWLERNEDKLLNNPELRQGMRGEGVGGSGDAPPTPSPSIPKPMRGSSPPAAAKAAPPPADAVAPPADAARAGSTRPEWLQRLDKGNAFDDERAAAYPHNEVYIDKADGSGYTRLDSYNPTEGEIVSRKFTQLSEVQEETASRYINEIPAKYPADATIADVPSSGDLAGQPLLGQHILEVPVQNNPVPQSVLDTADQAGVIIRDVDGTIY